MLIKVYAILFPICVLVSSLLTQSLTVELLEQLVEPVLTATLQTVANGSGGPAQHESSHSALHQRHLQPVSDGLVFLLVHLPTLS